MKTKKEYVSIRCPECHKEIFGSSIKACKVNLKMHNKSTIHKAIVDYKETSQAILIKKLGVEKQI